jgi:hypothetical protein
MKPSRKVKKKLARSKKKKPVKVAEDQTPRKQGDIPSGKGGQQGPGVNGFKSQPRSVQKQFWRQ